MRKMFFFLYLFSVFFSAYASSDVSSVDVLLVRVWIVDYEGFGCVVTTCYCLGMTGVLLPVLCLG